MSLDARSHHRLVTRWRSRPPGQLPCGAYGLAPHHFGVLVAPSRSEHDEWYHSDRAFAVVLPWSDSLASVDMDLKNAGPMPEPMPVLAKRLIDRAAHRSPEATPFTASSAHVWICLPTAAADALPLALVLVELWWGNDTGARRLLAAWDHTT